MWGRRGCVGACGAGDGGRFGLSTLGLCGGVSSGGCRFDSQMMAFALDDPKARASLARDVPLGRIGMPDDMAGVAIYLASAAASYVTGAVVPVAGGLSTVAK